MTAAPIHNGPDAGPGGLGVVDSATSIRHLGASVEGEGVLIPFYGVDYRVSRAGVTDPAGRPATAAVASLLVSYIHRRPDRLPSEGEWMTFREFSGAGPLMKYFVDNTNKLIEHTFAEDKVALQTAGIRLGATVIDVPGYDIAMEFMALPRIPLRLRFNPRDSEFPAQCSLVFRQSAEIYLDMKSMASAGTWLAGNLVR